MYEHSDEQKDGDDGNRKGSSVQTSTRTTRDRREEERFIYTQNIRNAIKKHKHLTTAGKTPTKTP
jgi:hypothetical protein